MVSKARRFNTVLSAGMSKFLVLRLSLEAGQWDRKLPSCKRGKGAREVEIKPTHATVRASSSHMDLKPPGVKIEVELAGVEVRAEDALVERLVVTAMEEAADKKAVC